MRAQLRVDSPLGWVVAWLLALGAPAWYLLQPDDLTWWLALLLPMPLVALAARRQERKGFTSEGYGGGDSGPWTPPSDAGGI